MAKLHTTADVERSIAEATRPLLERLKELERVADKVNALAEANVNSADLICELEEQREASRSQSEALRAQGEALADANVRAAELLLEIEDKNSLLEKLNSELADKNFEVEEAHRRLENSYDDLQKEQALREINLRAMEADLRTARMVQAMLIPELPPTDIPGLDLAFSYTPAAATGGDWLGFHHDARRSRLTVMLGDVTGHGAGPALMTAGVFSFFSALRHLGPLASSVDLGARDLNETLETLSRVIHDMARGQLFMTFIASEIDYNHHTLHLCNAGHQHPLALRTPAGSGDRPTILNLISIGHRLGDPDCGPLPTKSFDLAVGDLILWFTDGLIENPNPSGQAVGTRRLLRWLRETYDRSATEIRDHLCARMDAYTQREIPEDDMAFIVAKITPLEQQEL